MSAVAKTTASAPLEVAQMRGPTKASELLEDDGEVEIITTAPTRYRAPSVVAREELVRWCLQHSLPVPPPREHRCQ